MTSTSDKNTNRKKKLTNSEKSNSQQTFLVRAKFRVGDCIVIHNERIPYWNGDQAIVLPRSEAEGSCLAIKPEPCHVVRFEDGSKARVAEQDMQPLTDPQAIQKLRTIAQIYHGVRAS